MSHTFNQTDTRNDSGTRKKVLIIDDEPAFTRLVKLNLEKTGEFEVREQNLPNDAVRLAKEFNPHLILLDIIMPGVDGGDVYASLKADADLQHIPILYVTATLSHRETGHHGLSSGGAIYLAKPLTLDTLVACINEQIAAQARV